jgi:hypothetical protein
MADQKPTSTSEAPQTPGEPKPARPDSLLLTFERDGMVTDQQVSPRGFDTVSTALTMIARLDELLPGDKLTVEKNERAGSVPPIASPAREA